MALTASGMIVVMQATLLVLAGGESRRMGRPKAWLEVGETTLLRWMVERLGPAFSEVVVSFAEPEQLEELVPYRLVFDRQRAAGPPAGIVGGAGAPHPPGPLRPRLRHALRDARGGRDGRRSGAGMRCGDA